jgi:hypothetical protein
MPEGVAFLLGSSAMSNIDGIPDWLNCVDFTAEPDLISNREEKRMKREPQKTCTYFNTLRLSASFLRELCGS